MVFSTNNLNQKKQKGGGVRGWAMHPHIIDKESRKLIFFTWFPQKWNITCSPPTLICMYVLHNGIFYEQSKPKETKGRGGGGGGAPVGPAPPHKKQKKSQVNIFYLISTKMKYYYYTINMRPPF
jgi:hypothetical protein